MTNLDRVLVSRDITLLTKVHMIKAMVFPVVMCGYDSWTIRKTKFLIPDAFELCLGRLLNPLGCKEIKLVNPKGNQP